MIDDSIARKIELYLFERADWVHAAELEKVFNVTERQLRDIDGKPGYCTRCAASMPSKGYKHIDLVTPAEWTEVYNKRRKHAIGELRSLRALASRRRDAVRKFKVGTFEKDTGQGVWPSLQESTS